MRIFVQIIRDIHPDLVFVRVEGPVRDPEVLLVFSDGTDMVQTEFMIDSDTDRWFESIYEYLEIRIENGDPVPLGDYL